MNHRILVVEDEVSLQETLTYTLELQGYVVGVVGDGTAAIKMAQTFQPDLVLLDILLPGLDGFEVCRILRQTMNMPIIFLSARDDEIDRIVGLEIGADDYITKPFNMRELLARIKARLRMTELIRKQINVAEQPKTDEMRTLVFGNLTINVKRHEVLIGDQPIMLNSKEFELILFFTQHVGRVVSREAILQNVWGYGYSGDSRTVDVHVRWLREKIELDSSNPTRLITIRGAGYRFEG
jgi:DNA-binding response OmpR family regulator